MNHPFELLADLLDGTLDADTRAQVDAHLATCDSCRVDLAFAAAGRDVVRTLPQEAPPADLHERVTATAGGRGDAPSPRWYRWAGVAAPAAVVAAIAVALPNVGSENEQGAPASAIDAAGGSAPPRAAEVAGPDSGVALVEQDKNYSEKDLQQLAQGAGARSDATFAGAGSDPAAAIRCVTQAAGSRPDGQLVQLIKARFQGHDAYLAVFLESPGADQPADTAAVWVAARDDCPRLLSFAYAKL